MKPKKPTYTELENMVASGSEAMRQAMVDNERLRAEINALNAQLREYHDLYELLKRSLKAALEHQC